MKTRAWGAGVSGMGKICVWVFSCTGSAICHKEDVQEGVCLYSNFEQV